MHFEFYTFIGILGGVFYLASHSMRRMVPLRVLALLSNVLFLIYAVYYAHFNIQKLVMLPEFLLNLVLLPMNVRRLLEIFRLTRQIEHASVESPVSEWLLPHMHLHKHKEGHTLFRKGELADSIYYIAHGRLRLEEIASQVEAGDLLGEIGLFAPDKKRALTAVCETDCELYRISDEEVYQLYYQNPKLGFYFMRLILERLLKDTQQHNVAAEVS
jgi:CRP/FNR family transcriptional regulator, cyclic AMP receptor protein